MLRMVRMILAASIILAAVAVTLPSAIAAPAQSDPNNLCSAIYSPGYWKNWKNHYTAAEFQSILSNTMHFSSLTPAQAVTILNNNRNQFQRHLLSAELNAANDPYFGYGTYADGNIILSIPALLDAAYNSSAPSAALDNAIRYIGSNGEGASSDSCRVVGRI